jgi:magnesium transporter
MRETESLHELRETNNSLLTTKQNETMKKLTLLAFITFPLSLIASIFEMNTVDMPIVGLQHGFWIIIGGMTVVGLAMFWYFKYKKWF